MKSRVPAIILALGISASPVFAKQSNRRADTKNSSKIEESKQAQRRVENSYIRQKRIELEKEFIKETELEINEVLSSSIDSLNSNSEFKKPGDLSLKVVEKDSVPVNGIDISEEFQKIQNI